MIAPSTAVVPLRDWAVAMLLFFSVSKSAFTGDDQVEPGCGLARDRDVVRAVVAGHEVIETSRIVLGTRAAECQQVAVVVEQRELLILAVEPFEDNRGALTLVEMERVNGDRGDGTAEVHADLDALERVHERVWSGVERDE